jgi:hypothetical protein
MRRIIYLSPADNRPTGGIKVIYRHAELLRAMGADAYVLHPFDTSFACTWFQHDAALLRDPTLYPDRDFVIMPELWAAAFGPQCIDQGVRFGLFVQNGYYCRPILPDPPHLAFVRTYAAADLVLAISDDTAEMIRLYYPMLDPRRVLRVQYSVPDRFVAPDITGDLSDRRCITFMPRKMAGHASSVVFALSQCLPPGWRIVQIDGMNEATVIERLHASSIFLSFSEFEGLPLPPLEAALAGNLVIGYTGQGAREYWDPPNFREVHQGDIRGYVTAVREAIQQIEAGRLTRTELQPGIGRLADRFSVAAESANLCTLLDRIETCGAPSASPCSVLEAA